MLPCLSRPILKGYGIQNWEIWVRVSPSISTPPLPPYPTISSSSSLVTRGLGRGNYREPQAANFFTFAPKLRTSTAPALHKVMSRPQPKRHARQKQTVRNYCGFRPKAGVLHWQKWLCSLESRMPEAGCCLWLWEAGPFRHASWEESSLPAQRPVQLNIAWLWIGLETTFF